MARSEVRHRSTNVCALCLKGDTSSVNRPNSLKKTRRIVKPNLQSRNGVLVCQKCARTIKKIA